MTARSKRHREGRRLAMASRPAGYSLAREAVKEFRRHAHQLTLVDFAVLRRSELSDIRVVTDDLLRRAENALTDLDEAAS